jgi:hypothetical protein
MPSNGMVLEYLTGQASEQKQQQQQTKRKRKKKQQKTATTTTTTISIYVSAYECLAQSLVSYSKHVSTTK